MAARDLYEVLGVRPDASQQEIQSAWKKLALRYHPDRNANVDEEKIKAINEAYEVLSDPDKRKAYDRYRKGQDPFRGSGFGGPGGVSMQFDNFADFFEAVTSAFGGGGRSRSRPTKGADYRLEIWLTLEETAGGITRPVEVPTWVDCTDCNATGARKGTSRTACKMCQGTGTVTVQQGFFAQSRTCSLCNGKKTVALNPCRTCDGEGSVRILKPLTIDVPAGVEDGHTLKWKGKGAPSDTSGPSGDLYIIVKVKEHPLFERNGQHLKCTVPISFTQAAIGGKIDVPTLDGKVIMSIPAGTQSGKTFRLKGKGFPHRKLGQGDQLVHVVVETPVKLNARQRELLEEFARESGEDVHPEKKSFIDRMKELFGG